MKTLKNILKGIVIAYIAAYLALVYVKISFIIISVIKSSISQTYQKLTAIRVRHFYHGFQEVFLIKT